MALPQENVRALNDLRQRLRMLAENLHNLDAQLQNPNLPLPAWSSLSSSARLIANNLAQLQEIFTAQQSFLRTAHVYPHASYPVTEDAIQQQLLRKKLHPAADDWIDEHVNPAKVAKWDDNEQTGLSAEQQRELWRFAGPTSTQIAGPMIESGALDHGYTYAEMEGGVENVKTGLRRKLEAKLMSPDGDMESDDDEEDEGEEDKVMEDVMPAAKPTDGVLGEVKGLEPGRAALPVEAVMRFMYMGVQP